MADSSNPLSYSDLIRPDDSILNLIKQLDELNAKYEELRKKAGELNNSLRGVSGATEEGREKIRQAAEAAERMAQADKSLSSAQANVEREIRQTNKAVEEQVKTYAQIRSRIDQLNGSLQKNIDTYRRAQSEINRLRKAEGDHTLEIARLREERNKANAAIRNEIRMENAAAGSLNEMRQQLISVKNAYAAMSGEMRESSIGQETLKTMQKLDTEVSKIEQSMGVYSRNVGNYRSAFNGLNVSIQQVARELPSLSTGASMFFLAISNNLPILSDELKRAREEYNNLRAAGQKATPVWKQVVSSIFSWQTALVAVITVLSMYGQEIVDWIAGLFKAKDATDRAAISQEIYNRTLRDGAKVTDEATKSIASDVARVQFLTGVIEDNTRSISDRRSAILALQQIVPDYHGSLTREGELIGHNTEAIDVYIANLRRAATAQAAFNQMAEIAGGALNDEIALRAWRQGIEKVRRDAQKIYSGFDPSRMTATRRFERESTGRAYAIYDRQTNKVTDYISREQYEALEKIQERWETVTGKVQQYSDRLAVANSRTEALEKVIRDTGVSVEKVLEGSGSSAGASVAGSRIASDLSDDAGMQEEMYQRMIEARRRYEDAQLAMQGETYEARQQEIRYEYERQIEDLQHQLQAEADMTREEREAANAEIILLQQQLHDELYKLEQSEFLKELEQLKEQNALRLRAVKEGTEEEYKLRLEQNEINRQIALGENRMQPASDRQSEQDINAAFNAQAGKITADRGDKIAGEAAKDAEKQSKKLQSAYRTLVDTVKVFSRNMGEAVSNFTGILTSKVGDKTIYEHLGLTGEQAYAAAAYAGIIVGSLQDIAAARVEAANAAVEEAEKETEAARDALQVELEARRNGYANRVSEARKELQLAQKNQQDAEKEQQRALRQQQALQSIAQMGNLVTASTLIWSMLGFPAAIPAIAAMWVSFAATKIKAATMTGNGKSEQYGEGTVELLQGGSHQSGDDIDLGTKPDGTRRRAEGGEFFAVINKRNSRRFRKVIPDVIRSFNDGSFIRKYSRMYENAAGNVLISNGTNIDLSRIERDLSAIRKGSRKRYYTDGKGRTVVAYKNLTRRIYV